jgi:polyisoprenoid-binding protein YceI
LTRRRAVFGLLVVVVLAGAGGLAWFLLEGDAPPPPALEPAPTSTPAASSGTTTVSPGAGSFVGYRVREEFISFGVKDAVGRTKEVRGTVSLRGRRIVAADLTANMRLLQSDKLRRDNALRFRAIETDRFPDSHFVLTRPAPLSRNPVNAEGRLTLHGVTAPVRARLRGQRLAGNEVEVVGTAPIEFRRFGIEPPSVAGFVTVQDHGVLEFKLNLR